MPKIDHDTKEKILAAAEKVFHRNGFKGTRTTEIAQEAGISRTMLHYYYSTKEELFQEVMNNTLGVVFPHLARLMEQNLDLVQLVSLMIDTLCDLFEAKPTLPSFVVNIINESPDVVNMLAANSDDDFPHRLDVLLNAERQKGNNIESEFTGEDLMMNIYSLCATPYLGYIYIKTKENRTDEQMMELMRQRRQKIKNLMLKCLMK
ncbi:TetR/AcrR family transcriptional regulator [Emticicia sp. W12TSBA100-4]|uniref:TetR/AcrR family transcriptional regulator n=1 Tax=Emticicia sp. W12TSBA100-4 TaxID=3160965 RepID=UPI003305F011